MPIPKPKKDEKENDFISRCVSDSVMLSEYPDNSQRTAVCSTSWGNRTKTNRQHFILNQKEYINEAIQNMSALVKKQTLENTEYYVIPVIMAKVGVMNNLFYSEEELSKFPESWNGRPVLYDHPIDNKTAGRPEIKEEVEIGTVYNSKFEDEKLKAEVWLNIDKCSKICPAILNKLNNNEMIEVSTGLFGESVDVSGTYNNSEFEGSVINIKPDHLAVLPFDIGACSVADGAGMPRINKEKEMQEEKKSFIQRIKDMFGIKPDLIENQIKSFDETRDNLRTLLRTLEVVDDSDYLYLDDVFPGFVIYTLEKMGDKPQTLMRNYVTDSNGDFQLSGDPIPVRMRFIYERLDNGTIVNNKKEVSKMEKETLVNSLIESEKFEEADREELLAMNESMLEKLSKVIVNEESDENADENSDENVEENSEENSDENSDDDAEENSDDEETTNNIDEFLDKAPKEIRETLKAGLSKLQSEKSDLIANILKVKNCTFTEESLKAKDLEELTAINSLIAPVKNYAGKGGNADEPKTNNSKTDEEPLKVPSLFESK